MKKLTLICTFLITLPSFGMEGFKQSTETLFEQADYVFLAKVIKREPVYKEKKEGDFCWVYSKEKPNCGTKVAYFNIKNSNSWKGGLSGINSFIEGDACYCLGSYLDLEQIYIVFARRNSKNIKGHLMIVDAKKPWPSFDLELNELKKNH